MCYITTIHSKSQRITTTMTSLTPAQAQAPLIAPPAQSTICSPPQTYTTPKHTVFKYILLKSH